MKKFVLSLCAFFAFAGCSTSQKVSSSSNARNIQPRSAFVVTHEGRSKDMDKNLKNALFAHGVAVSFGVSRPEPLKTDLLVTYDDSWHWDLAMYLRKLNIQFMDASGNILVTGDWENSALHGFPDAGKITSGLVNEMMGQLKPLASQKQALN